MLDFSKKAKKEKVKIQKKGVRRDFIRPQLAQNSNMSAKAVLIIGALIMANAAIQVIQCNNDNI